MSANAKTDWLQMLGKCRDALDAGDDKERQKALRALVAVYIGRDPRSAPMLPPPGTHYNGQCGDLDA
jgi:hypothetical protein